MDKRLMTYTVDQLVAKTATGRDRDEVARERAERFKNVAPIRTKEEFDAWVETARQQQQQSQS